MTDKHFPQSGAAEDATAEDRSHAPSGADAAIAARDPKPDALEAALDRIGRLEAAVAERDEEILRIRDQFLRERADLENFKKRMTREKAESLRYAAEPLIRDLLPVLDNLERALSSARAPGEVATAALRDGVAMVAQQFDDILGRFGVARLQASGQPFDPNEHEALAHVETTRQEPGLVLDEHLPGYRLHDRLLRAAQVTVAKAPNSEGN